MVYCHVWLSYRQGRKNMKVTAVELADMTNTDSKDEQDAATAVDNICNERVPSLLNVPGTWHQLLSVTFMSTRG